ncbi:acyl-CoA dehydrogenase family protein [Bradyrhizobium xenonodulans]|uniref:Acyl-CoA dehydrogenase family protein n=1 Tax=Bradyrhizobium xenonodulans TaxID=2736875 RepID=A0ABY7MBU9_9BRAD|nr:acyl-CoA dehydrogenase family protein [Bradyrhizobium xenonodulans]WBL75795.1 acyl-CoA dehydrogenase family protein [Bradyrhizobium xenonodulans]
MRNHWDVVEAGELMSRPGPDLIAGAPEPVRRLLEAVQALDPLIAAQRSQFDGARRLPDEVFAALADAGLFRLWLPGALGGPELSPLDFMRVVEAASALDGSVGWLVGNGGGMSRIGGYLGEAVAREWFADPRAFVAGATGAVGTATAVAGGYRLSGRWPFGSGAHHAARFMGLASVRPEDPVSPLLCCYLGRAEVTILDNWHVSGLRGTGSCDFEARDVFVPAAHVHPFLGPQPTQPGLLYRLPPVSVFAWSICGVPLGIASGAIASFAELACRKSRLGTRALLRDRETVQATVGRARATLRAARTFLIGAMTELMAAAETGGQRLVEARADIRIANAHAAETAMSVADELAASAGAAAIFESCALERAVRDVHAAAKHIAMSPNNYIVAGRLTLGLDPGTARF